MLLPGDPENHTESRLRWVDSSSSRWLEEVVQVLDSEPKQVILCCGISFDYGTSVSLLVGDEFDSAVVIACRPDQEKFIVIIQMVPSHDYSAHSDRDPGLLAVDNFLTEEQERLLLEEIEQEWQCSDNKSSATAH